MPWRSAWSAWTEGERGGSADLLTVSALFVGDDGRLRAFWRLGVFCAAVVASWLVVNSVFGPIISWVYGVAGIRSAGIEGWIEVGALLGGTWVALRWVDACPWREVGLDQESASPASLVQGFALGCLTIGAPTLLLVTCGWMTRRPGAFATDSAIVAWLVATARISAVLIPAALAEELLARGYVLSVIRDASDWRWALTATSIGFGLLHLANNGATAESIAMVMLAGVFLGLIRIVTGSLYAAWMAHLSWNWTMAAVFHTAVSGYPFETPAYRYVDAGPKWATGGIWGPEASLPAGLSMILMIGYLMARRRRRQEAV